jgi:hypothetical protein
MPRAKKHPKLPADERVFLNRLDCLNEEEIKQLTTREIFAYFKIIDKVDSRADVRRMVRTVWTSRSRSAQGQAEAILLLIHASSALWGRWPRLG